MGEFNIQIDQYNQIQENLFNSDCVHEEIICVNSKTNKRGHNLLNAMEDAGMFVLNGRKSGDTPGAFTFINKNGKSTIDLAWANLNIINKVTSLSFFPTLTHSPHSIGTPSFRTICYFHLPGPVKTAHTRRPLHSANLKFNNESTTRYQ